MNTRWRTVRVFISSTFRDMQAERDHLVRLVFPRLRAQLLPRRIHLLDVDLRWGVTSEQDASEVCREIIDECRPRFLCMLGGRYGSIPGGKDLSITADEVHFGVLEAHRADVYAFFYFRDAAVTELMDKSNPGSIRESRHSEKAVKLARLKRDIRKAKHCPFLYHPRWSSVEERLLDLNTFGDRVERDILATIDDEFGVQPPAQFDEFAEEDAAMDAFVEERRERFVLGSRGPVLEELLAHASASGGNGYLCLVGAPGSGKSALLADLSQHSTLNSQPSILLIRHFIGASPGSTDVRRTLRRLCHELKAGCRDISADIPDDPEKLPLAFADFLGRACAHQRVVILLDAVNQFDSASHSAALHWLPEELPANARVILSALDGPALEELRRRPRKPREIELKALTADDGEAIIEQFRQRYRKKFEPDQRAALLGKTDAGTPLYLLAALEELRTLGTYEEISRRIAELPPTTRELFAWILERLENDDGFRDAGGRRVGRELVSGFAALLGASRYGLNQRELAELLAPGDAKTSLPIEPDPLGNVAALLHLLRPYLMRRGELLDFYHGQFREAAMETWLKTDAQRQAAHSRLARYFGEQPLRIERERAATPNLRKLSELPHHLLGCGDLQGMGELVRSDFLEAKAETFGEPDAIADAGRIAAALAEAGEPCWNELLRCAETYCGLTERLQAKPEALEVLIRRGEVSRVVAAIESEPDEARQAMLKLAASVLLAEAGHTEVARQMRERAAEVAGPRLSFGGALESKTHEAHHRPYSVALRCLGRALLDPLVAPAETPAPQSPSQFSSPEPITGSPHGWVPFADVFLAYFSSPGRALVSYGWLWLLLLLLFALKLLYPHLPRPQLGVLGQALMAGLVLLVFAGPFLLLRLCERVLARNPERIDRAMWGLVHAAQAASPREQRRILFRALRYQTLLRHTGGTRRPWIPELCHLLAPHLGGRSDPARAAEIVYQATDTSDAMIDGLIGELRRMSAAELERIYAEVAKHPARLQGGWQYLRIIVATASVTFDPERLVRFIKFPPGEDTSPVVRLLQGVGTRSLARAVLAAVRRGTGTTSAAERILAKAQSGWEMVWGSAGAVRSPIARAEPLLWGCIFLPAYLGLILIFSPGALALLLYPALISAGRTHDAYGMWRWLPAAGSIWPYRDRIERTSEEREFSSWEAGLLRPCGFIPEAILARALVTRDRVDWRRDSLRSEGQRRRVLSCLVRSAVLGHRGDVVLATMGHRQLLKAATTVQKAVGRNRRIRTLEPDCHEHEVKRVLPIASPWTNLGLVLTVSSSITLAWTHLAGALSPTLSVRRGLLYVLAALGLSAYFSVVQHVTWAPERFSRDKPSFWFPMKGVASLVASMFLAEYVVWRMYGGPFKQTPTAPVLILLTGPLLITGFLVPEFIARWRGTGLLYPTKALLWRQRLVTFGLLVMVTCALAGMTALVP